MEMELSHSQSQVLSRRMQLSVKILQLNALDLEQYIQEAALENPLIELEVPQETEDRAITHLKKLEWLNAMDESNSYSYAASRHDDEQERSLPLYEKNTVDSLTDVLLGQVPGFHLPPETEQILRYLIGNLDENGYLTMSHEQIMQKSGSTQAMLADSLKALYLMDPPGVGAVDLRECLLIQTQRLEPASPVLVQLIDKHLDLLAKNQLSKLAGMLHVSIDDVKKVRDQLLTLNPKPGNGYSSYKEIPYIRPDVFIVRFESSFQVIFNDYNQPKIEINSYYRALAKDPSSEAAEYLDNRLHKAEWLVSCINQRKKTLLGCVSIILKRQLRFFEQGPGNLLPMTLAQVADDLDMHPSTISRAVRGKYLQCQWGVFGLADFFTRSIDVITGEECSQDMVQRQIKSIITEENSAHPFSDQEIVTQLQKYDINIARRTVAKYRELLGLPNASGRKAF